MHIPPSDSSANNHVQKTAHHDGVSPPRLVSSESAVKKETWLACCVAESTFYLRQVEKQIDALHKTEQSYAAIIWMVIIAGLLALFLTVIPDALGSGHARPNNFDPSLPPLGNAVRPGSLFEYGFGPRISLCAALLLLIYRLNKNRLKCHYEAIGLINNLHSDAARLNESVAADDFARRAFHGDIRIPGSLGHPVTEWFYPPRVVKPPQGGTSN